MSQESNKPQVRQVEATYEQQNAVRKEKTAIENASVEKGKEYVYTLAYHPYGSGTFPRGGVIRFEDNGIGFGQLVYDHKLTEKEVSKYELRPETELQGIVGKSYSHPYVEDSKEHPLTILGYDQREGTFKLSRGLEDPTITEPTNYGWKAVKDSIEDYGWLETELKEKKVQKTDSELSTIFSMYDQYKKIKEKHPNTLVLVRSGMYYNTFNEDAEKVADITGSVLFDKDNGLMTSSIKFLELDYQLPRLIKAGERVAILSDDKFRLVENLDKADSLLETVIQRGKIKKQDPKAVVLVSRGDFYEAYADDAKKLGNTLGIGVIIKKGEPEKAGFPKIALEDYLPKMLQAGMYVAVMGKNLQIFQSKPSIEEGFKDVNCQSLRSEGKLYWYEKLRDDVRLRAHTYNCDINLPKSVFVRLSTGKTLSDGSDSAFVNRMHLSNENQNDYVSFFTKDNRKVFLNDLSFNSLEELRPIAIQAARDYYVKGWSEKNNRERVEQNKEIGKSGNKERTYQISEANTTAYELYKQFSDYKKQYPNHIVLLRTGEFYESYDKDAEKLGDILGLTVSKRKDSFYQMAGFPAHALEEYLPQLVVADEKVAIANEDLGLGTSYTQHSNLAQRITFRNEVDRAVGFKGDGTADYLIPLSENVYVRSPKNKAFEDGSAATFLNKMEVKYSYGIDLITFYNDEGMRIDIDRLSSKSLLKDLQPVAVKSVNEWIKENHLDDLRQQNIQHNTTMSQTKEPQVKQENASETKTKRRSTKKTASENVVPVEKPTKEQRDKLQKTIVAAAGKVGKEQEGLEVKFPTPYILSVITGKDKQQQQVISSLKIQKGKVAFINDKGEKLGVSSLSNVAIDRLQQNDVMEAVKNAAKQKEETITKEKERSKEIAKGMREGFRDAVVAAAGKNVHNALEVSFPRAFNVDNVKGGKEALSSMKVLRGRVTFTNDNGEKLPLLAIDPKELDRLKNTPVFMDAVKEAKQKKDVHEKVEENNKVVKATKEQQEQFTKDIKAIMGDAKSLELPNFGTKEGVVASLGNEGVSINRVHNWDDNISFVATIPGKDDNQLTYLHPKDIRPEFYDFLKSEVTKAMQPKLVTENGQKVTSAVVFKAKDDPNKYIFYAKLDGTGLHPKVVSNEDAIAFQNQDMSVKDMFEKYYPTKLARHLGKEEFDSMKLSDGQELTKFRVYKQNKPEKEHYKEYMMYAEIGNKRLHALPMSHDLLDAYFDRTMTKGMLAEKVLGEQLHLKSAYEKYILPDGVDKVKLRPDKEQGYVISAILDNGRETKAKKVNGTDLYSYFKAKTATTQQLAAKYLMDDIKAVSKQRPLEVERQQGLKR